MSKEMSDELNDEVTDSIASKVLTTKRPVTASEIARAGAVEEAPLKSGLNKVESGTQPKPAVPRPLPLPVASRIPAKVSPPAHREVAPPGEARSQVPRPSARPTLRPGVSPRVAGSNPIPRPPGVPSTSSRTPAAGVPTARPCVTPQFEEESTRVCPAAVIEKLLNSEAEALDAEITVRHAADDVTRVGQVPIEELVLAQRALAEADDVGHEDVTRTYTFNQEPPDTPSQVTSPGKRQLLEAEHEPLVIIQTDRPKRGSKVLVGAMLLGLACAAAAGWHHRTTLVRYSHAWGASFQRGIAMVTKSAPQPQKPPARATVVNLSVSVTPTDAVLTIDGSRVANPYTAQRSPDKGVHNLVVEAPGYVSLQRQVQFDRDLTVVLALAPLQKPMQEELSAAAPQAQEATPSAPRSRVHKSATKATQQPTTTGTAANCNPPFSIDAAGIKTYKPECL